MRLPHPLDRPHQRETYNRIIQSRSPVVVVSAPTGSGKSAWAAQAACDGYRTLTLTRTKSLQAQYQNGYGFEVLYGKGNYTCMGFDSPTPIKQTADLCTIRKSGPEAKQHCYGNCEYPLCKQEFLGSQGGSLNYSKFLLDRPLVEKFDPDIIFMDEGHELSDIVTDFAGTTISYRSKRLRRYIDPLVLPTGLPQPLARPKGRGWLGMLYNNLSCNAPTHPSRGGDKRDYLWWERLKEKVDITLASMRIEPTCWYVHADNQGFVCKPLTAQFHFAPLFDKAPKLVIMSATLTPLYLEGLGLGSGEYEFIRVPHIWEPGVRPIVDLGGPTLKYKSTQEDWATHASLIAGVINTHSGSGIIHSPSKWLAKDLVARLKTLTDRPLYLPQEGLGTEQVAKDWQRVTDGQTIGVFWQLWEGADLGKDDICIVAKTPFINFGDPYDKARFEYDRKGGLQRVANKMVQGLGRIRRGHPDHYGNGKFVGVCDGAWKRVRNYIDQDILASVVKG